MGDDLFSPHARSAEGYLPGAPPHLISEPDRTLRNAAGDRGSPKRLRYTSQSRRTRLILSSRPGRSPAGISRRQREPPDRLQYINFCALSEARAPPRSILAGCLLLFRWRSGSGWRRAPSLLLFARLRSSGQAPGSGTGWEYTSAWLQRIGSTASSRGRPRKGFCGPRASRAREVRFDPRRRAALPFRRFSEAARRHVARRPQPIDQAIRCCCCQG